MNVVRPRQLEFLLVIVGGRRPCSIAKPGREDVRENWRRLPVREWTAAELRLANGELDAKAAAFGMTRLDFVRAGAALAGDLVR